MLFAYGPKSWQNKCKCCLVFWYFWVSIRRGREAEAEKPMRETPRIMRRRWVAKPLGRIGFWFVRRVILSASFLDVESNSPFLPPSSSFVHQCQFSSSMYPFPPLCYAMLLCFVFLGPKIKHQPNSKWVFNKTFHYHGLLRLQLAYLS